MVYFQLLILPWNSGQECLHPNPQEQVLCSLQFYSSPGVNLVDFQNWACRGLIFLVPDQYIGVCDVGHSPLTLQSKVQYFGDPFPIVGHCGWGEFLSSHTYLTSSSFVVEAISSSSEVFFRRKRFPFIAVNLLYPWVEVRSGSLYAAILNPSPLQGHNFKWLPALYFLCSRVL